MTTLTNKQVLQALRKAGGIIESPTAIEKLMHHMDRKYGPNGDTVESILEGLAAKEKVVIARGERGRITLIATPDEYQLYKMKNTDSDSEKEAEVAVSRAAHGRIRGTTYPQDHDGTPVPSRLRDDQCGPVEIRYATPGAGSDIATLAELVIQELRKADKTKMIRSAIHTVIQTVVQIEDTRPAVVESMSRMVMEYLTTHRILTRAPDRPGPDLLYTLHLPELPEPPVAPDKEYTVEELGEVIERLSVRGVELRDEAEAANRLKAEAEAARDAAQAQLTELKQTKAEAEAARDAAQAELANWQLSAVDPATFNTLMEKAEALTTDKENLEKKITALENAHAAKVKAAEETGERKIARLEEGHRVVVKRLEDQIGELKAKLDTAEAEARRLQQELSGRKAPTLNAKTVERLAKLGIGPKL